MLMKIEEAMGKCRVRTRIRKGNSRSEKMIMIVREERNRKK